MSDSQPQPAALASVDSTTGGNVDEVIVTNHSVNIMTNSTEHVNGVMGAPAIGENGRQDSSELKVPKKESTFKITSVTLHSQKGSSQDGRHSFGEDEESAVEDSLIQTDAEDSPAPVNILAEVIKRQDKDPTSSRFKVVKIQRNGNRGRWRIRDEPESEVHTNSKITNSVNEAVDVHHATTKHSESGNSSRAGSTHYVHGVDDPSKNPLASINASSNQQMLPSIQQSPNAQPSLVQAAATIESTAYSIDNTALAKPPADQSVSDSNFNSEAHMPPHIVNSVSVDSSAQSGAHQTQTTVLTASMGGGQLPGHINTPQQLQQSSDQSSTVQINTQVQSVTGGVNPAAQQTSVASGNSDSQSISIDNPNNPDSGGGLGVVLQPPAVTDLGGVEELAANLTELVESPADGDKPEDPDAAASGVAIDNKIEQAMDLVKSHLMLAVREEVEDLKLQIKGLVEKNNQLEQENKLLRASAAPETIAQLTLLNRTQNH